MVGAWSCGVCQVKQDVAVLDVGFVVSFHPETNRGATVYGGPRGLGYVIYNEQLTTVDAGPVVCGIRSVCVW